MDEWARLGGTRTYDTLPNTADHTSRNKNVLRHLRPSNEHRKCRGFEEYGQDAKCGTGEVKNLPHPPKLFAKEVA